MTKTKPVNNSRRPKKAIRRKGTTAINKRSNIKTIATTTKRKSKPLKKGDNRQKVKWSKREV